MDAIANEHDRQERRLNSVAKRLEAASAFVWRIMGTGLWKSSDVEELSRAAADAASLAERILEACVRERDD